MHFPRRVSELPNPKRGVVIQIPLPISQVMVVILLILFTGTAAADPFTFKDHRGRVVRVLDGDSVFRSTYPNIRGLGYEAPELPGKAKCAQEGQKGLQSRQRLFELVSPPNVFTLRWGKGRDNFGRRLAWFYSNHKSVNPILIAEGLAKPRTRYGKRPDFCASS